MLSSFEKKTFLFDKIGKFIAFLFYILYMSNLSFKMFYTSKIIKWCGNRTTHSGNCMNLLPCNWIQNYTLTSRIIDEIVCSRFTLIIPVSRIALCPHASWKIFILYLLDYLLSYKFLKGKLFAYILKYF